MNERRTSGNIHYRAAGDGSPTLIFVHGFACAAEDWSGVIDRLAPRRRCLALDLPGHGASPLAGRAAMADQAAAVQGVRDAAGSGPVVLIGHSLGVRVIVDVWLARPENVAGLVFVDGRFYDGDPEQVLARMTALVDAGGFEAFVTAAFAGMFTDRADPAMRDRVVRRARRIDPAHGRALLLESILWDSTRGREALSRIRAPLLHLQSSDIDVDRRMISLKPGMRTRFMELVDSLVPGATVDIVPDVGHFAMLDDAAGVAERIEAFLRGLT